jgi:hypothetical protein
VEAGSLLIRSLERNFSRIFRPPECGAVLDPRPAPVPILYVWEIDSLVVFAIRSASRLVNTPPSAPVSRLPELPVSNPAR